MTKDIVLIAFTRDNRIETIDMVPVDEGMEMIREIAEKAKITGILSEDVIKEIFEERSSMYVNVTDELTLNVIFE